MTLTIDTVTVRGFRGVRGEQTFEFGGRNGVVVGPNGAGKSTVLQAVEFLLTGEVSALRGQGTGGIHPTEHVPNQYADPDETAVTATFTTADGGSFRALREFTGSSGLRVDRRSEAFDELVDAANQGLLYLSRGELLELVTATPGNRKDQIYHLMNTQGLDGRRKQLKRLKKRARDEAAGHTTRYEENLEQLQRVAGDAVVTTVDDDPELRPTTLRHAVNERRARLGGDPIDRLDAVESFRDDVPSPLDRATNPLQREDVQRHLRRLHEWFESGEDSAEDQLERLSGELRALRADESALDAISQKSLVRRGLDLVDDETRACPLCQEPWDPSDLQAHLSQRIERLERIDERVDRIESLGRTVADELAKIRTTCDRLLDALAGESVDVSTAPVDAYRDVLVTVEEAVTGDSTSDPTAVELETLDLGDAESARARDTVDELRTAANTLPDQSTMEATWTELQSLDDSYRALRRAGEDRRRYARAADELAAAHRTFLDARDDVLGETFEAISHRFAEIYEAINPDENAFDPAIGQTNTGVEFSVEFYDTGEHPPNALHSEGHQDLMGISLFLALASEFSPLERVPILLDDVVMSVDESHRNQFARVLQDDLSDQFQFLFTTHDPAWAQQLVDCGVVRQSDVLQFTEWSPQRGPVVSTGPE